MTLLGLGVAVVLLALIATARGKRLRPVPLSVLLGLYLAPAVFLALLVWFAPAEAYRLRLSLLGIGFRAPVDEALEVKVGGDRSEHEVWISAFSPDEDEAPPLPVGAVRFNPRPEQSKTTEDDSTEGSAGEMGKPEAAVLVATAGSGAGGWLAAEGEGSPRPVAALALAEGDRLTVSDETWTLQRSAWPWQPAATLVAEASGQKIELPRRVGEVPVLGWKIPLLRVHASSRQTYPLPVGSDSQEPLLFFEPQGWTGGTLFLLAPQGAVIVERAGRLVEPPSDQPLESGDRLYALSPPRPGSEPGRAGGLRDRRSFRVVTGERSLAFLYDTREVHTLGPEDLDALRLAAGSEDGENRRVSLALGSWQVVERSLYLRHASDAVAAEALASLELPESLLARWRRWTGEFGAATPRGAITGRFGEPIWLGDRHAAAVQIDVLRPPLALVVLGLLLALAKALTARAVRLPAVSAVAAAGLEGLVALRLALGYRVWAAEPHRPEAMELALVAWALLPWTFLVASMAAGGRERVDWRSWILPGCGLLFSLAWCLRLGGSGLRLWGWVACHLVALAIPMGRHLVDTRGAAWSQHFQSSSWVVWFQKRPVWGWSLAACAFLVIRAGLLVFGYRESVQLGQRFALSLVHVPAAVLLEAAYLAWLWRRAESRGRVTAVNLVPALIIVATVWVAPAFLVSDLGLALLGLPVFLIALAAMLLGLHREDVRIVVEDGRARLPSTLRARTRRWALSGVVVALALILAGYALAIASPLGARAAVAAIPEDQRLELESERNFLRFLGFAYPDELAQVGRRTSEELATMAAVMGAYTGGPPAGRGWFSSEWSPHIAATALREHVPSVFVAGEWGLAGTLGLIALYFMVAWGGTGGAPWRLHGAEEAIFAGTAAAFAAITLAFGGLYMVAANYRLTLFTGKNAYLLGLDSTADVLESFVLALMLAAGLAWVRDREVLR